MSEKKSERKRNNTNNSRELRKRRIAIICISAGAVFLVLGFFLLFNVRSVEVVGNDHYTDAEIVEMVTERFPGKNAALLWLANRRRKIEGDSFIDTVSVELTSPWAIRIRVEEKKLAGYIRGEDKFWYFDASGIARVSSTESELMCLARVRGRKMEDTFKVTEEGFLDIGDAILHPSHFNDGGNYIPFVLGARADSPELGQSLNESMTSSFRVVAAVKNYIDKCSFRPDSVEIRPEGRIWLHIGDVVVDLGSDIRVEIKLRELEGIYPKLSGRRGTLHLENYDGTRNRIIFSAEAEPEEEILTEETPEDESTAEDSSADENTTDESSMEESTDEESSAEEITPEETSEEENTAEETPPEEIPPEENPEEEPTPEGNPEEEIPPEESPEEELTPEESLEEENPAEENPEEEIPPEENPEEELTLEEGSAEEDTAEENPEEEITPEENPAEEIPAEENPAEEITTEESSAEDNPAEENPAEEITAEESSSEENPAEENPVEEIAAEGSPAEEIPTEEESAA